ncbi:MAG: hypothetical protein J7M20_11125, partial [Deltaproteobacteria bacterium]|nr:hypothetical protein [Deltaproteobacteria bacterium]
KRKLNFTLTPIFHRIIARMKLNWNGAWDSRTTFAKTAIWYQSYYENQQVITEDQLKEYVVDVDELGLAWVN